MAKKTAKKKKVEEPVEEINDDEDDEDVEYEEVEVEVEEEVEVDDDDDDVDEEDDVDTDDEEDDEDDEDDSDTDYDEALFPDQSDVDSAVDDWNNGLEETAKGQPEGNFSVEIIDAEVTRSSSKDRLQIHYKLLVLTGDSTGTELHKYDGLEGKSVRIAQNELSRIGVDPTRLTVHTLPAALLDIKGIKVACRGRINNDFYNVNFQRRLGEEIGSTKRGKKKSGRRFR